MEWNHGGQLKTIIADERGGFSLVVPDTAIYNVTVMSPKYYDTSAGVKHVFETMNDSLYSVDFFLKPIPEVIKDYMVYFEFDKFGLTDSSKKVLDSVITMMTANPTWKMALEGHTDGKGSDEYNMILSQHRADTCLKYLAEHQIDATRLLPSFYGKAKPAAPNETPDGKDYPEGRQLNRRVKLSVIKE